MTSMMAPGRATKCLNCFNKITFGRPCDYCNYDNRSDRRSANALPPFTLLNGRYEVGKVLGEGGFGITYLAKDYIKGNLVAVKEFFPCEIVTRSSNLYVSPHPRFGREFAQTLNCFFEEANILNRMQNLHGVVTIYECFQTNGTAYISMEYLNGMHLNAYARELGGVIPYDDALIMFLGACSGLLDVHKLGILHLDISPENIFRLHDGRIMLIDFGASRQIAKQASGQLLGKPGYSPPEQMMCKPYDNFPLSAQSDIYALSATFYKLLTHHIPPAATRRINDNERVIPLCELAPVPRAFSDAIMRGLSLDPRERFANVTEFSRACAPDVQMQVQDRKSLFVRLFGQALEAVNKKLSVPVLEIVSGVGTGCKWRLERNRGYIVGRKHSECDIVIGNDLYISRQHFTVICRDDNKFSVQDVSRNGILLNGIRFEKMKPMILEPGTIFSLASSNVAIRVGIE